MLALIVAATLASNVRFTADFPDAKKVEIAGDFNAWSGTYPMEKQGSKWVHSFDLRPDARIEYKLIVDGKWILDPANPNHINNGIGGENSIWTGPQYRFTSNEGTPKQPMVRTEINVDGRTITVFAPAKSAGLPILVYGDGPNYENFGKVQNVLENLVEAHWARPAVIVLVPPIDRMKEYGAEWKAYGEYIFHRALPEVRKLTGASSKASDTFMGGSSLGGLISLRLAEEVPNELAGGIHCQSSSIQWRVLGLKFGDVASVESLKRIAPTCRIWFDWGVYEDTLSSANEKLAKTLRSMHRPFGMMTTPEGHTWTAWRNRMVAGLSYILASKHKSGLKTGY